VPFCMLATFASLAQSSIEFRCVMLRCMHLHAQQLNGCWWLVQSKVSQPRAASEMRMAAAVAEATTAAAAAASAAASAASACSVQLLHPSSRRQGQGKLASAA